jgi:hypothetical protein
MANLTGSTGIFAGDTSVVDTTLKHPLGTKAKDADGNEYIYLQGIGSTTAGDWVVFDEAHLTTRTVSNVKGRIGVAMAAIVASSYGWYQIYGKNIFAHGVSGSIDDNDTLFVCATAGSLDDTDVSADFVLGAIARSADTSGVFTAELNYPFCPHEVLN